MTNFILKSTIQPVTVTSYYTNEREGKKNLAVIKRVELPIEEALNEYVALREQEKTIKKRKEYLAKLVKDYADKNGVKDDKGSMYSESDSLIFGKTAVKKVSFKTEEAINYFKNSDNAKVQCCVLVKEVIDEEAVSLCIETGDLTLEDIEPLTETKTTYSVLVKEKEVVDSEVEEYTLPKVAKTKRRK